MQISYTTSEYTTNVRQFRRATTIHLYRHSIVVVLNVYILIITKFIPTVVVDCVDERQKQENG